tara:strand:- start:15 stop:1277 length:1263 start_codon:yes stop_codon:yes gene_type:complete
MLNLSLNFIQKLKRIFFPFYKHKELKFIFKTLHKNFPNEKIIARFVGGCVRKHLLNQEIDDIDVSTILTVDEIKERFKDTNLKIIDTGLKHGTITLKSKNYKVEITTLRKDKTTDGRHAEIEYTNNWHLDSERRDFTINAIYLDINGKIFDPQMGMVDLKNKNVKFIGDPQKRIEEDYLRIIRFIRFKIMYDTNVETSTSDIIKQNLDGIKKISKERILVELLKILSLKNFFSVNENKNLREIFNMIFPEFLYLDRLKRLEKVSGHKQLNKDTILATILLDEKDNHEYFAHKYNISNKLKKELENLALNLSEIKKNKNFFNKDLLKNIYIYGKDYLISLNFINFAISSKIKIQDFSKTLKRILKSNVPKFHIDGEYLKKNGMTEGESLGKVLKTIEEEWMNNSFKISDQKIKELIKTNSS